MTLNPVSLIGYDDVTVTVALAAQPLPNFETNDYVLIEYEANDSGTFTTLAAFRGNNSDGSGEMAEDTNLDGVGDGTRLTATYQDFTYPIPEGVYTIVLRIAVKTDDAEEVFLDNIRIHGTPGVTNDPIITLNTDNLNFGSIPVNSHRDISVEVRNFGVSNNLTIENTSTAVGSDAGFFSIVDALPKTIPPGATDTLTLRFASGASGGFLVEDATMEVHSNATTSPVKEIALRGLIQSPIPGIVEVSGVSNPPTTFATILEAVKYLEDNFIGGENIINITTDGPLYETGIIYIGELFSGGLTINGDADGNGIACTIITDASEAGSQENFRAPSDQFTQFYIAAESATYQINDLILQPIFRGTNMTLDNGSYVNGIRGFITAAGNFPAFTINFNNVIIGGSKAGNVLAANPNVNEYFQVTRYDRGITAASAPQAAQQHQMNYTRLQIYNTYHDAIAVLTDYVDINFNEGCIFAWAGNNCLLVTGANHAVLNINGIPEERILVRGSAQNPALTGRRRGVNIIGPDNDLTPFSWETMTFLDSIENGYENEMGRHCGPNLMENCFFAFNDKINDSNPDGRFTGLRYGYGNLVGVIGSNLERTIRNCTFLDTQAPGSVQRGINLYGMMDGMVFNLENVIIAGTGDHGIDMRAGGDSILNIRHSALVTMGPDALASALTGAFDGPGTGNFTVNMTDVVNWEPIFGSRVYIYGDSDAFLQVNNPAFLTAGPDGGPLTGAGQPAGPTTNVGVEWMDYK